jgi:DNA-binding response OmpR family regulator
MEVAEMMAPGGSNDQETRTAVVLMVDDDPQLRVMLGYALRQDNFQVEEASSGEEALEMLKHQQPDVILLDVLMPGMGGVETCRRIREQLRRREMDALSTASTLSVDEGNLVVDAAARQAIVKGRAVDLSPREFDLLHRLAQTPGKVVSHEELLEHVWGTTSPDYLAHLRSYIKLLRQKVEPDPHNPRYIRSRARMGYVLTDRPETDDENEE